MTREELIRIFEEWKRRDEERLNQADTLENIEIYDSTIKLLKQDIVPFDFELYEAGLMDMPKGMVDILDKIRDEILEYIDDLDIATEICDIFDKYTGRLKQKEN